MKNDKPLLDIDELIPEISMADAEIEENKEVIDAELKQTEKRLEESGVLNAELIAEVKKLVTAEIITELKENDVLKQKELEIKREQESLEHANYVALKMESEDPWVEIVGDISDEQKGQRIELNWNPAFIVYLKKNNITGADEEQIVQKYISLLLQDMVDRGEERFSSDYE